MPLKAKEAKTGDLGESKREKLFLSSLHGNTQATGRHSQGGSWSIGSSMRNPTLPAGELLRSAELMPVLRVSSSTAQGSVLAPTTVGM